MQVTSTRNGWANQETVLSWMNEVVVPFKVENGIVDFGMVMDRFTGHTGDAFATAVTDNGGELFLIPGGCTSILQPLDCTIMFAFKSRVRQQWKLWKIHNTDHLGRCPQIQRTEFVDIVSRAWDGISPEAVRKSWEVAGLALQPNRQLQDLMDVEIVEDEEENLHFLDEVPLEV